MRGSRLVWWVGHTGGEGTTGGGMRGHAGGWAGGDGQVGMAWQCHTPLCPHRNFFPKDPAMSAEKVSKRSAQSRGKCLLSYGDPLKIFWFSRSPTFAMHVRVPLVSTETSRSFGFYAISADLQHAFQMLEIRRFLHFRPEIRWFPRKPADLQHAFRMFKIRRFWV